MKVVNRIIKNLIGTSFKRRMVLFLVDDWGTSTIDSDSAFNKLADSLIIDSDDRFNRYDAFASPTDLDCIFDLLLSFKDKWNRSPKFTGLVTCANPVFEIVVDSGDYCYESFDVSLSRKEGDLALKKWVTGIREDVFEPQFHCREHINVKHFIKCLRETSDFRKMVEFRSIGVLKRLKAHNRYLRSFELGKEGELDDQRFIIEDGLSIFQRVFGHQALQFSAPGLIYNPELNETLAANRIMLLDVPKVGKIPLGNGGYSRLYSWTGRKSRFSQRYITRNVRFEPSSSLHFDWVDSCLKDIDMAFKLRKPAIISSHRVNFVSGRSVENRDNSLKLLRSLLKEILNRWPDTEFTSASNLLSEFK